MVSCSYYTESISSIHDWSAHVTPTKQKTGSAETEGQLALDGQSTQLSDVEVAVPE